MKKSQSLKGRKFNIIIPKISQNIPEKYEIKNSEIIIKTLARLPDLHLPIKKVPHNHITYKKQKNQKINPISLEKLKLVVLNLKMRKKEQNKREKSKNKKYITSTSPSKNKHIKKNNYKAFNNNNKKVNNKSNDLLINNNNDFTINSCQENNTKLNKTSEININRSSSLETDIYPNFESLQFRNKDKNKKWYNNIEFLTEKYNELILTTENLEKNIMSKYLDGTDNIM